MLRRIATNLRSLPAFFRVARCVTWFNWRAMLLMLVVFQRWQEAQDLALQIARWEDEGGR